MIGRIDFFPSPTLSWYVAKMFVVRSVAILAMLVLILLTLDLLGESGKVLAHPGNGDAEIWRYVSLRLPQLIARFLPFAVLLGTLLTLVTLNQNSEVVSMKSAGMSAHQILAPLVLTSLVIAGLSFAFNERVLARANATLSAWQKVDYAPVPRDSGMRDNVWARSGDTLVGVRIVRTSARPIRLEGVTIFEREGGTIRRIIAADSATQMTGGWTLTNAQGFDADRGTAMTPPSGPMLADFAPDRFTLANVDGDELGFPELRSAIAEMQAAGRGTTALEAALWHKISGPLSVVLMPLLGAVAAFGLARSGQLLLRAVIGMALGFAFFVVDNFGLAMGNLGAYPAWLAAWGPFMLFLMIGEAVLVRTEE
jgi:lipopolysaccharide export system permease protein